MAGGPFRFPVYQIDFSAVAAGKRVAATKRRIRWRFGFPNREALAEGKTGIECRGEEHEVVIVWSVTSGKRQIMMDGKEVHYSMNRTGILDHSWTARGNHILKVVCHAAAPMTANPNFRQYDLFIDGQSFFLMPKVYELGLRGGGRGAVAPPAGAYGSGYGNGAPSFASPAGGNIRPPQNSREEEEELQRAINASIEESRKHLGESNSVSNPPAAPPAPATPSGDLLSMDDGPTSPGFDTMSFASAPPANYYSAPAPYPAATTPQYGQQPPTPQYSQPPQQPPTPTYPSSNAGASSFPALPPSNSYGAPPPPPQRQQAPPPPQPAYGAPPPGQPAYAQAPPPPVQTYAPAPPAYMSQAPAPVVTQSYSGGGGQDPLGLHSGVADDPFAPKPPSHSDIAHEILSAYSAVSPSSTMGPGQSFESPGSQGAPGTPQANGGNNMNMMALVEVKEEEPLNPFDAALKKLVNIDHIDEPAEEQLKLTMKKQEDKNASKNKGKSRGLPPVAKNQVGSQATLSQISSVKPAMAKREDIMNAPPQPWHPDAAAAGMLVVHGQHPQNGPPPLQPQGFGVGYRNAPNMGGYGGGYGGYGGGYR